MIADVLSAIDAAIVARDHLRRRPIDVTCATLAAAATAWATNPAMPTALADAAHLDPTMIAHVLPLVAGALDPGRLALLHAREAEAEGPALVAAVLASNVPALAVPAIALACLAGAAVLVKSGRGDTDSAGAFHRAIARIDPDLAATIVPTYWRGGTADVEDAVLARADVVVVTGGDVATGALATRLRGRVVTHGPRTSCAVLGADPSDETLYALALDVARYEQRGCLSPQAVLVTDDAHTVAKRLARTLDAVARVLPRRSTAIEERAGHRVAIEEARFAGATVIEGSGGTILVDPITPAFEGPGVRTVRIHAIDDPRTCAAIIPPGRIECVGVAPGVALDAEALRRRGVARICPVGRMQAPPIDWPRGQHPALGSLFRASDEPRIQVEP